MEGPDLDAAVRVLEDRITDPPRVHVVLGSGLSDLADEVEDPVDVSFVDLPGFPATTVAGHDGRFVSGRMGGVRVLLQAGRFHYYEGVDAGTALAPVRLARRLGAGILIVTNAAGGIRRDLAPGDLMLIDDHVNLMFRAPLAGPVEAGETRFPDMSAPYDRDLMDLSEQVAVRSGVRLVRGVYGAVLGPSYETPAEVRALARMGVDAVGMSTVPEVICARALGMRVVGFSMISNPAAGLGARPLSHDDVVEVGRRAGASLRRILVRLLPALEAG
jgi:purine-nucleoside phosphorylase